ncbi:MAG: hypothetical protein R2879_21110 [Saprospiraceae bacterium]
MAIEDIILGSDEKNGQPLEQKRKRLLNILDKSQEKVLNRISGEIKFSDPILFLNEKPFIYPDTINIIQGKSGVHKSRLVEIIMSVLVDPGKNSRLGFRANQEIKIQGLYVDTERNQDDQLPYSFQQISKLTGINKNEIGKLILPISMIEVPRIDRLHALWFYLEEVRNTTEGHLVVVLDVITDCVEDFNSAKKSMELIDMMNHMINEYDITFISVIHENPGFGDKARGHLGTELNNKSSATIQIKYLENQDEILKVTLLKARSVKSGTSFHLKYCDLQKTLIIPNESEIFEVQKNSKEKAKFKDLEPFLINALEKGPIGREDLLKELSLVLKCGTRILEDRLKEILNSDFIITSSDGQKYTLDKFKDGRNVIYGLKALAD